MDRHTILTITINSLKDSFIKSMLFVACILLALWFETQFTDDDLQKNSCDTRQQQSEIRHDKTSKENCFL